MSNWTKRQKELALVIVATVLLAGSAAYSYFSLYAPARDARLQAEQLLSSEKEVLMALQAQQKAAPVAEKISTSALQQKVAVEPMADLILLQIEQAELISGTLVTAVNFTEAPLTLLQPVEGLENVQEIITTVEFNARDYKSITAFIKEIEAMERIMVIDSIDFASNEEITTQEQEGEPLTVSVSFSAFFRPDLIKLEDTLPKVDSPAPAKKSNPLPQNDGTDLVVSSDSAIEASSENGEENTDAVVAQTATVHTVVAGETLLQISRKYYGDNAGAALIQEANNLSGSVVKVGMALTIPQRP
ncbi:LysM peptidoglycan-binding domain-containing protein [Planomicrobium sp. CPCC 101079]|uniref:LysM peptidoglycan-binding domain-containing protein n=1 Tax=Planomicrobium sp. CPCC 101079 TaxID=2599618 RepID=UPI0016449713|nr:LysM peptidoglycan-binding domain-containing protein [Planomicrobium sp. CPCC 101079]